MSRVEWDDSAGQEEGRQEGRGGSELSIGRAAQARALAARYVRRGRDGSLRGPGARVAGDAPMAFPAGSLGAWRLAAGLTRGELCRLLGEARGKEVSYTCLRAWETGQNLMPASMVKVAATVMGLSRGQEGELYQWASRVLSRQVEGHAGWNPSWGKVGEHGTRRDGRLRRARAAGETASVTSLLEGVPSELWAGEGQPAVSGDHDLPAESTLVTVLVPVPVVSPPGQDAVDEAAAAMLAVLLGTGEGG